MAKWYGKVGYAIPTEVKSGVWKDIITEHEYYGDILSARRQVKTAEQLNDHLVIQNRVSIVADPFAMQSVRYIRYVEFMGSNWEVSDIEVQFPHLILSIGGIYNGKVAT